MLVVPLNDYSIEVYKLMFKHRSLLLAKSHEGEIWLRQRITILKQNSKRKLNHLVGATSAQAVDQGDHRRLTQLTSYT